MLSSRFASYSHLSSTAPIKLLCANYHTSLFIRQPADTKNINVVESYTESQAKKGRFVSPHVTIYKFPITALSSITNRVTGVFLTIGTL